MDELRKYSDEELAEELRRRECEEYPIRTTIYLHQTKSANAEIIADEFEWNPRESERIQNFLGTAYEVILTYDVHCDGSAELIQAREDDVVLTRQGNKFYVANITDYFDYYPLLVVVGVKQDEGVSEVRDAILAEVFGGDEDDWDRHQVHIVEVDPNFHGIIMPSALGADHIKCFGGEDDDE